MKLRLALIVAAFSFVHAALAGPRFLNCDYNGGHVSIVAADGSIEWQIDAKNPQDCWLLPNGNILFCNYLGHGHIGQQAQLIEVTPEKKVVWTFGDHALFNSINQVQLLDGGSLTGTPVTVSGGTATLTTAALSTVGMHSITAHYVGDATYTQPSSSGALNVMVTGTTQLPITGTSGSTTASGNVSLTIN